MKEGISLVALVITIIVLIILTGAVISNITSDNNIISKASEAVQLNNDSVLSEKIVMQNMENMLQGNPTYTDETKDTLKQVSKQSKIDIDKLFVYNDIKTGKQYVCYKLDKVNKEDIEWLLNNEVIIDENTNKKQKIYFLFGDVNFDEKLNKEDIDLIIKFANSEQEYSLLQRIAGESDTNNLWDVFDINDYNMISSIAGNDIDYVEVISNYIDTPEKIAQIKTYFEIQ